MDLDFPIVLNLPAILERLDGVDMFGTHGANLALLFDKSNTRVLLSLSLFLNFSTPHFAFQPSPLIFSQHVMMWPLVHFVLPLSCFSEKSSTPMDSLYLLFL